MSTECSNFPVNIYPSTGTALGKLRTRRLAVMSGLPTVNYQDEKPDQGRFPKKYMSAPRDGTLDRDLAMCIQLNVS
jgi:hypothetical protein